MSRPAGIQHGRAVRTAVALVSMQLAACSRVESSDAGPPVDTITLPKIVMSASRPTRRYFVERTSDRCSVYFEDAGQRSKSADVPCVQDLLLGERIRVVGATCIREASSESRSIPVMCPNELSRFLRDTERTIASALASASAPASSASARPSSGPRR